MYRAGLSIRLIISGVCLLLSASSAAEIYRWVDDKGNVHFGDKPGNSKHTVIIQQESDYSTIGLVPEPDKATSKDTDNKNKTDEHDSADDKKQLEAEKESPLPEKEKARLDRIEKMNALAEELRAKRLAREARREKEKKELEALREGCASAQEKIDILQGQVDRYVAMQKRFDTKVKTDEDVVYDPSTRRKAEELKARKDFVAENCQNL